MKLTYIANARVPSEKAHPYQVLKMCEAFSKQGVTVDLILPYRLQTTSGLKEVKDYWSYYGIERIFKVAKLPSLDVIWIDSYTSKLGTFLFRLQAFSFALFALLYSLIKKAEIYYTRETMFACFFSYLSSLHGKKICYEAHDFTKLIVTLIKKGKIDRLIVITNILKELYIKGGVPEEKILVAADGVDLSVFNSLPLKEEARNELGIPPGKKLISYTGHLYDWKGAHILAMSMKYLSDNYVSYFIGGMRGDLAKFKEFIRRNEITNAVTVGYVPPLVVPKYLVASDVLVLPNIEKGLSHFTSPLKLFEYMASRRPVVASDLPSTREVLNEENAILVEPGNPKALAEGIQKVIEDKEFADEISEKAYRDVQQHSWDMRAQKILEFIEKNRSL